MAVAGVGLGYCGAQLKSDGINVNIKGSIDMSSSCNVIDTLCVLASDVSTLGTCTGSVASFDLTAQGRKAAAGTNTGPGGTALKAASPYPGTGGTVTLDRTSGDDLHFGPTTPITGVGAF